jgi:hypothetical protein
MSAEKDVGVRNKEAIRAGFEAWRNGTGNVFDLLALDAKWTIVGIVQFPGPLIAGRNSSMS